MQKIFDPIQIRKKTEEKLGLSLSQEQAEKLSKYAQLLLKWNKTYNLTSIESPDDVVTLHLIDSLSLVQRFDDLVPQSRRVLDVGSGGGLPAVVLSIMRPDLSVTMVDAVQKKVIFLRQCIAMCRLSNARALHARIESLQEEPFDVITSRAFASLADTVRWSSHLLNDSGSWLSMKGKYPHDEIEELPENIEVTRSVDVDFTDGRIERCLLLLTRKSSY